MKPLNKIVLAIGVTGMLAATSADAGRNTWIKVKNCSNKMQTFLIKNGKGSNFGYTQKIGSGDQMDLSCAGKGKGRCKVSVKEKHMAHYNSGPTVKRGRTAYFLKNDGTWSWEGCS